MILVHNHPSGNVEPSEPDKIITKNIVSAAKLLEITILDHLIVAGEKYFSFADEGIINI
jgi:DNA repair protein RadC